MVRSLLAHTMRFRLFAALVMLALAGLATISASAQVIAPAPVAEQTPVVEPGVVVPGVMMPSQDVPAAPLDPRAGKVYAIFDTYCASCHQTGRLKIPAAARPMANILALDELANEPTLVLPGVPDASALYTIMLRQHATVELNATPDADAVQAVRDWILDLPPATGSCATLATSRQADLETWTARSLAATDEKKRKDIRFITLGHLADVCTPKAVMDGYRQAITKVVNTLSWAPEPIRLEVIDPEATIIRFDLSELGWVAAHWDKLIQNYPYAALASSRLGEAARRQTGTLTPALRGDWLAYAATATPLFARLLGLPGRMANLQRILNIDIEASIRSGKVRRAGVAQSTITRANRLVERHPTRIGSLWIAYDFATNEGRQNLANNPFGPTASETVKVPFKHDGTRAIFTLPNGFFAYSVNDPRGDRLDTVPEVVDRDELTWAGAMTNGAACMACHRSGPFGVKDSVRPRAEAETVAARDLRDQILALYAPQAEMDVLVAEDQQRYADAQRKVGIDPNLLIAGLEPVAALARQYTKDVSLPRLAAEAGLSITAARASLAALPTELVLSGRRIVGATATRSEADRVLVRLAPDAGSTIATMVVAAQPEVRAELELLVWSRNDVYQSGELATFHARASQNCYLTLVNLDRTGQATILFPNEFQQNNLLLADQDFTLPGENASYQFRLRDKGRETLVGICQTTAKTPEGIQHDFERQRFTMLGDWRAYLAHAPLASSRAPALGDAVRPKSLRRARGRPPGVDQRLETKTQIDQQSRTAITYDVR